MWKSARASYWSQTLAVTNLDRLMEQQLLPDVLTYFENIPAQLLPNKREIIRRAREKMQREAAQAQAMQQTAQAPGSKRNPSYLTRYRVK